MAGEDELFQMELNLHPNEASGLLMIGDEELLEEHGWDLGFWACLDDGEIEDCVAAIGHRHGYPDEEGWEIERLRAEAIIRLVADACQAMTASPPSEIISRRHLAGSPRRGYPG